MNDSISHTSDAEAGADASRPSRVWTLARRAQAALLLAWFASAAVLMIQSWLSDPFDPDPSPDGRLYGHNGDGALARGLTALSVELLILAAVLRPWSYRWSLTRPLFAGALFAPWTWVSMLMSHHQGGVFAVHVLSLVLMCVGLFVGFIWSILKSDG